MSETLNNIIRFDYSADPTTLMGNSWITNNTDTAQNTVTPVGEHNVTHYWRTITFNFTGKADYAGVFRIEVDEHGVPVQPYTYESISGDAVEYVVYTADIDRLVVINEKISVEAFLMDFSVAIENTEYREPQPTGTWSYVASTTTETVYEVELYVNSDVTTFPNNLFYNDENITSVEFDTYSITSIEDGSKSSGAFFHCVNLASIILPNNIEYIGDYFAGENAKLTSIILPSTVEEIGNNAVDRASVECYALNPPILHSAAFVAIYSLTIHETALQSYINSDWADYVTSIDTIETPTYNNVLKFDYAVDPTSKLDNLWVQSCTDTSANTIVGVGEHTEEVTVTKHWREVTYTVSNGNSGTVRVGWENNTYTDEFEVVEYEGTIVNRVSLGKTGVLTLTYDTQEQFAIITTFSDFINAEEDHLYEWAEMGVGSKTGTNIYTNTTTTETETITVYDHYEVTLHLNSAISSFESLMFAEDTDILSVEFPASITYIGDDAFNGCTSLASVTMNQPTPPTLGDDVFKLVSATLFVPEGSIQIYRQELGGTFPTIKPIKLPAVSFGFNLSRMGNVDYVRQGVVRRY